MSKHKYLILIGGAPTTGKSTIAKQLAKELEIPWISTDQIRSLAQNIVSEFSTEDTDLLLAKKLGAEKYYSKFNVREIAEQEIKESEAIFKYLKHFIESSYPWKSFIVEGVNVLPELLNELNFEGKIIPIFLVDANVDNARKVIFERGLWGPAKSYSDAVKEKEVEWVGEFSKILISKCNENNLPFFEISKDEKDIVTIIEHIKKEI
jgi:2-phosphoglycerate kinase